MKTVYRRVLPENPEDGAVYIDLTSGLSYGAWDGEWHTFIPSMPSSKAEEERETPYEAIKSVVETNNDRF